MARLISSIYGYAVGKRSDPRDAVVRAAGGTTNSMAYSGVGLQGPWDYDQAVSQGLERVLWVFRCVDVIATDFANLPLHMVERKDKKNERIIEDDLIDRLLNIRANEYETAFQFRYRAGAQGLLSKRGVFIEKIKGRNGRTVAWHLLPPGVTKPIPGIDPTTGRPRLYIGCEVTRADGQMDFVPADRVIWIKWKPHPSDPYLQLTPLMAAGIVADTDWLARVFNRQYLASGGANGPIVSVTGEINEDDKDELKRRFGGGPIDAGRATVIGSDIAVSNLNASPKEASWLETIQAGKEDILLAFGVPESVMGNASGRTFDNADAEEYGYWLHTQKNFTDTFCAGIDILTGAIDDGKQIAADYSEVDALQYPEKRKREEARAELAAGARSLDDYLEVAGRPAIGVAASRVHFLPNGLPVGQPQDVQEVAKLPIVGTPSPNPDLLSAYARRGAVQGSDSGIRQFANVLAARAGALGSSFGAKELESGEIVDAEIVEDLEEKAHPYLATRHRLEGLVEGSLAHWDSTQEKVVCERLIHTKSRKGTRHWDGPEGAGTKALNGTYAVQETRWVDELASTLEVALRGAVGREAANAAKDMASLGLIDGTNDALLSAFNGNSKARDLALKTHLDSAMAVIKTAASNQSRRLQEKIEQMDADGASMHDIEAEVRKMIGTRAVWRKQLAINVTTAAVEGARAAVYAQAGAKVTKVWNTEGDERVRHTHMALDGNEKPAHRPFVAGKALLQFPGDPSAPIGETVNCRCWLEWYAS